LGSVKSNIGHTQAAAGVAGVIKMVMALRNGQLPMSRYADEPTSGVDWSTGNVRLLNQTIPWWPNGHPRRAGISAFGFSGTNAHTIIEEPPAQPAAEPDEPLARRTDGAPPPWLLSARTAQALPDQAARLLSYATAHPELDPLDIGYSLATSRLAFPHRAVVAGADRPELLAGLGALARSQPSELVALGTAVPRRRMAMLFTGPGEWHPALSRELYQAFPAFAWTFDEACAAFDRHLDRPLREAMFAEPDSVHAGLLDQPMFALPALFTTQVALFRLLESWGLRPDSVLGHSAGELAAAHVAGVLSLKDAVKLTANRGQLVQELPGGAAVLVEASENEVAPLLGDGAAIAAINGPASVVVAGDEQPVLAIAAHFAALGRQTSRLTGEHPEHSPRIDAILDDLADIAGTLTYARPRLPIVSTLTGGPVTGEMSEPGYWVTSCRQPVRFLDGVRALESAGVSRFVQLGPDGSIPATVLSCLVGPAGDAAVVPVLRPGRPESVAAHLAAGRLYADGLGVDGSRLFTGREARRVPLPTYAFHRTRYWPDVDPRALTARGNLSSTGLVGVEHPVVGAAIRLADSDTVVLTGRLSTGTQPWLADHVIGTEVVFPGSGLVELAIRAGDEVGCRRLESLTVEAPLVLPDGDSPPVQVQVVVGAPDPTGGRSVSVHSRGNDAAPWVRHATGRLTPAGTAGTADPRPELAAWPPVGAEPVAVDGLYDSLAAAGLAYGPAMRCLRSAWRRGEDLFAEVSLDRAARAQLRDFGIHPAVLDAALHAIGPRAGEPVGAGLPAAWSGVELHATGAATVRVWIRPLPGRSVSLALADQDGQPVATIESVLLRPAPDGPVTAPAAAAGYDKLLLTPRWSPIEAGPVPAAHGPDAVPLDCTGLGTDRIAIHAAARDTLTTLRRWLQSGHPGLLAVVTRGAMALAGEEVTDLAGAAAWGLVRSAQLAHPGRFILLDADEPTDLDRLLPALVATGEPQLLVRDGVVHAARLVRPPATGDLPGGAFDGSTTTLVTNADAAVGELLARHLVVERGVRHLLLASRDGAAPAAADELTRLGATVTTAACDLTDREAVATLLAAVPAEHPLAAVVHLAAPGPAVPGSDAARSDAAGPDAAGPDAAGSDAAVEALHPDGLDEVLRREVDVALTLDELIGGPVAFLVLSPAAGLLGDADRAGGAAADACLGALVARRRARGGQAQVVGWAPWTGALAPKPGPAVPSDVDGLALFDAATARPEAVLVPARFVPPRAGDATGVPHLFRALVAPARRSVPGDPTPAARTTRTVGDAMRERIAGPPAGPRPRQSLWDLVLDSTAELLGRPDPSSIDPQRDFLELGFDSLSAVDLRNRINAATGLRLPASVTFEVRSPAALVDHVVAQLDGVDAAGTPAGGDPGSDGLRELFSEAVRAGRTGDGLRILSSVANLRPSFESVEEFGAVPAPTRISEGPRGPRLLCLATPVATGGAHQYARIGAHLQGERPLSALSMPGFRPEEPLPASARAAVDLLTRSVYDAAGDEPFALLGYSSSGVLAYAVAGRLERAGRPPAAVVLLDTYPVGGPDVQQAGQQSRDQAVGDMAGVMLGREPRDEPFDRTRLTAMARYMDLLPDIELPDIAAPTLLIRAGTRFSVGDGGPEPDEPGPGDWMTNWSRADEVRAVPGDHFSIVADHADATARAIHDWLGTRVTR
jgi:acyl transferase domain-containing protein/surfactin synthase thioesterase subunit/acyl carrier protein